MVDIGPDCYYFYNSTCARGSACMYRHVETAKNSTETCTDWFEGNCTNPTCSKRHDKQKPTCFYESQPDGCTRPGCQFRHLNHRPNMSPAVPTTVSTAAVTTMPGSQPPHTGLPPVSWAPPTVPPPLGRSGMWPGGHAPPPGFPHPPPGLPSRPFPPGAPLFIPTVGPPHHAVRPIQPIIINPNEESDVEASPVKSSQRVVAPPVLQSLSQPPPAVHNPLDYFLNAKRYMPPQQPTTSSIAQQQTTFNPYARSRSPSPAGKRGSLSPDSGHRRSTSLERFSSRRRSGSLDRSRSPPEWRDRRRFVRRSRSPSRRRSRSAERGRGRAQNVIDRFRTGASKGPRLEEVRVTGPKIISIKKTKEEREQAASQEEKKVEEEEKPAPEKASAQKESLGKGEDEEVKSLEEIYRERALLSLMEAKRKKIQESKKKRWQTVEKKKSESERSDKSTQDTGSQGSVDEKGDKGSEMDSSSDDGGSDIDFSADVDVEIGEGDLEDVGSLEEEESEGEQDNKIKKSSSQTKSSVSAPAKSNIKSRLGLKARGDINKHSAQQQTSKKRSIKDRLGVRPSGDNENEKPVRSGVIKLAKSSKQDEIMSRSRLSRERNIRESGSKNILMVPQITIQNKSVGDRALSLKQRLGLIGEDSNDSDFRKGKKKKRDLDEDIMQLIEEEQMDIDIDIDEISLLSKKDKKKLLKKLLVQAGREDEYDLYKKKKKRGIRKKKEKDDEGRGKKRKINIKSGYEDVKGDEEEDRESEDEDLVSIGEEIVLEEEEDEEEEGAETQESTPEKSEEVTLEDDISLESKDDLSGKSLEELEKLRTEKEARLREALELKTLDDIRKHRAIKKTKGEDISGVHITAGQSRRKIIIEEKKPAEKPEPAVRITFDGLDSCDPKRKLVRIGGNTEQRSSGSVMKLGTKKERQIYMPPTRKKTEEPPKKPVIDSTKGRDIVDYSDMFPKKTTATSTTIKINRVTPEKAETRPPLKLNKGPPKVEVKDATVKTFAEIMAEKKRKRQLTQQKQFTPITMEDSGKKSSSLDRLTPVELSQESLPSSLANSPVKQGIKALNLRKTASSENITETASKPGRWKRRKTNESLATEPETVTKTEPKNVSESSFQNISQPLSVSAPLVKEKAKAVVQVPVTKPDVVYVSAKKDDKSLRSVDVAAGTKRESDQPSLSETTEKKPKLSDSFLDFDDDDLLDMDDDLALDDNKDHDELMREIDELLASK
ncbi:zinc finger CCCH domain-containing protein 11A-like [Mya arenaria]|uniref:zinc finger CCCH domain-containing protein 11A-like n=1 Tax=Mya arenaria TaxID=6604 RepID=UPI0022E501BB|nr:zinc finger CCCH domain-containing protein 11A-like [Mya arenaria]XP_052799944.1 zinc finger CCCH domain-containing protein 11A-like [Mya arenaria]XP_052799945.1 zinc finger CCCH domain-containing protein 11A-like [Mya arenaria]